MLIWVLIDRHHGIVTSKALEKDLKSGDNSEHVDKGIGPCLPTMN